MFGLTSLHCSTEAFEQSLKQKLKKEMFTGVHDRFKKYFLWI